MEKSRNYLSKMDFEDDVEEEDSFDLNYIARDLNLTRKDDEFKRQPIESCPESEGSIEMPQASRAPVEEPLGFCRVESTLRRTVSGDLEDPPTYFPLVIRKVATHTKGATRRVAKLDCHEEGRNIDYETAVGDFKKNTPQVELMICITMYNEPFDQVKDSLTGVIRSIAELQDVDRDRFKKSIAVAIIADGYDRVDEDFLQMAE